MSLWTGSLVLIVFGYRDALITQKLEQQNV
jgi:hypothetical protein